MHKNITYLWERLVINLVSSNRKTHNNFKGISFKRLFCSRDCWANCFFFFFCISVLLFVFKIVVFSTLGSKSGKFTLNFGKVKQNVLPYSHSVFIRTLNFWAEDERLFFNLSPKCS